MARPSHLVLKLLLFWIVSYKCVRACDNECQNRLVLKFETLLDRKMNPVKLKINEMDTKLNRIQNQLELVDGKVSSIENDVEGFIGRSSAVQIATNAVKTMQDTMAIDPQTIKTNIASFEDRITNLGGDTFNMTHNLKVDFEHIEEKLTNTNSTLNVESIFEIIKEELTNITSNIGSELETIKEEITNSTLNIELELATIQEKITNRTSNIETELLTIQEEITNSTSNIESELANIQEEINNSTSNIKSTLKSMKEEMTNNILNIVAMLEMLTNHADCPIESGFFRLDGSNQCFKFYQDASRSWSVALRKCKAEGLVLAQISDPWAVRMYIVEEYSVTSGHTWVDGKGDGTNFRYERGNAIIPHSGPNWNYYNTASGRCLMIYTTERTKSYKPYQAAPCTSKWWTLCELSMN